MHIYCCVYTHMYSFIYFNKNVSLNGICVICFPVSHSSVAREYDYNSNKKDFTLPVFICVAK